MPGKKSSATREKVALALASGESIAEAAAGAHVSERQVHRWLAEDTDFNRLVAAIHEEILEESISLLVEAQKRAARRLLRLLGDGNKRIALGAVKVALTWQPSLTEKVRRRLENFREMLAEENTEKESATKPASTTSNGHLSEADQKMFEDLGFRPSANGWIRDE